MLLKILSFALHTSSLSVQALQSKCMPILRIVCYNGSLVNWPIVSLTTAKFKPLIFSVWLRFVLCCEHVHSHDFVWLLFVACTILLHNCIHTEGWKPCANRGPLSTLDDFQWRGEPCFVVAAILRAKYLSLIPSRDKHKSLLMSSVTYGGPVYCWRLNVRFLIRSRF
jgi:hypothetical protein